jgi:hypothetical protein
MKGRADGACFLVFVARKKQCTDDVAVHDDELVTRLRQAGIRGGCASRRSRRSDVISRRRNCLAATRCSSSTKQIHQVGIVPDPATLRSWWTGTRSAFAPRSRGRGSAGGRIAFSVRERLRLGGARTGRRWSRRSSIATRSALPRQTGCLFTSRTDNDSRPFRFASNRSTRTARERLEDAGSSRHRNVSPPRTWRAPVNDWESVREIACALPARSRRPTDSRRSRWMEALRLAESGSARGGALRASIRRSRLIDSDPRRTSRRNT